MNRVELKGRLLKCEIERKTSKAGRNYELAKVLLETQSGGYFDSVCVTAFGAACEDLKALQAGDQVHVLGSVRSEERTGRSGPYWASTLRADSIRLSSGAAAARPADAGNSNGPSIPDETIPFGE